MSPWLRLSRRPRGTEPEPAPESADSLRRYAVLVTALGGRHLVVAPTGSAAEPAYTDGETVFVRAGFPVRAQAIVHALLVGNGSLVRDVVAELRGQPEGAGRYLLLEMSRLCHPDGPWSPLAPLIGLPPGLPVPDSPAGSLRLATGITGAGSLPEVPAEWGRIRPALLLRRFAGGLDLAAAPPSGATLKAADDLPELDEDDSEDPGGILRALSSPVGSQALGRLLRTLLGMGRSRGRREPDDGNASGEENAEAGVGRPVPGSGEARATNWRAASGGALAAPVALGYRYPEWDAASNSYRTLWCTVIERPPEPGAEVTEVHGRDLGMRRRLARVGLSPELLPRQPVGDDVDLDAMVRAQVAIAAGSSPEDNVYADARPHRRELSVLVLLDISGSTKDPSPGGGTVFDRQREAAACLIDSLSALGARTAGYAFHSQGRHAVHVLRVKTFDEPWGRAAHQRMAALDPGGYTRLGAAVRHGTTLLTRETRSRRRLLVVLSDGFPYDADYQDAQAEQDSRRALAEARHGTIGCLCVSIGAPTPDEALARVFGSAAHANVPDLASLRAIAPKLFVHGLRTSDPRRRFTQLPRV